jgi:hypothetical protein
MANNISIGILCSITKKQAQGCCCCWSVFPPLSHIFKYTNYFQGIQHKLMLPGAKMQKALVLVSAPQLRLEPERRARATRFDSTKPIIFIS